MYGPLVHAGSAYIALTAWRELALTVGVPMVLVRILCGRMRVGMSQAPGMVAVHRLWGVLAAGLATVPEATSLPLSTDSRASGIKDADPEAGMISESALLRSELVQAVLAPVQCGSNGPVSSKLFRAC